MKCDYILALDQGTTSSRALLFDRYSAVRGIERQEFPQHYPQPGHVEHDPEDIWRSQVEAAQRVIRNAGIRPDQIAALGITNQRETTVLWERATGRPVANAIVWQDRRTAPHCAELRAQGIEPLIRAKTGLTLDPYFSATKVAWLLDYVPGLRERAERGEIAFGTVDSFLLWRLTGGALHATDVTNAARTLLFNIETGAWDEELLNLFRIPCPLLPVVLPCGHQYALTDQSIFGSAIPICGVAGDQHAALFGQACHKAGMAKCTYGTGSFLLMNTGSKSARSQHGLISTIAWDFVGDSGCQYALEGSVFVSGAAVQWLRDELKIIGSADEMESLAASVTDTGGVTFVPAFTGLGAPYWDAEARGALLGLTRGTGRAHIARAVLEAACHQTCDVLDAMRADTGLDLPELRVDGGMTVNNTLLQMQADLLGVPVARPGITETTALGAACLAGITAGIWSAPAEIAARWKREATFEPRISDDARAGMRRDWKRAVERVRSDAFDSATKMPA